MYQSSVSPKGASLSFEHIPVFARFQWVNSPQVVNILARLLRPPARGRKGYDKTLLFRWLMWKWLMRCSYRDLESMTGIDYSTFIKFRHRLIASFRLQDMFAMFAANLASHARDVRLILDSSFVATYSKREEQGSEYNGYKRGNGFKLHTILDFATRLPLRQAATAGARADVTWGENLVRGAPASWKVRSLSADKGYDSESFVLRVGKQWKGAAVAIPVRRFLGESWYNRFLKSLPRSRSRKLYRQRTQIERYFSRKKHVFHLGEARTRGLRNFEANCHFTSIMEYLEYFARVLALFTKLGLHSLRARLKSV